MDGENQVLFLFILASSPNSKLENAQHTLPTRSYTFRLLRDDKEQPLRTKPIFPM